MTYPFSDEVGAVGQSYNDSERSLVYPLSDKVRVVGRSMTNQGAAQRLIGTTFPNPIANLFLSCKFIVDQFHLAPVLGLGYIRYIQSTQMRVLNRNLAEESSAIGSIDQ